MVDSRSKYRTRYAGAIFYCFLLWFLADITPPVMMSFFAGAAIARAPAFKVGWNQPSSLCLVTYFLLCLFITRKLLPEILCRI